MTRDNKGAWMRRVIILLLIGAAAAAGYVFMPKSLKGGGVVSTAVKITSENQKEVQGKPGVLTVTNMRLEGNRDSDTLQEILEKLKTEKYGKKIQLAEVDIKKEKGVASEAGVDLAKFAGQLDFHSEGKKMGNLVAQTDAKIVEETIDNILNSMLQRMDKGWLPEVSGMKREAAPEVPGMKREDAGAVPGMTRSKGKQAPPSFTSPEAKKEESK